MGHSPNVRSTSLEVVIEACVQAEAERVRED